MSHVSINCTDSYTNCFVGNALLIFVSCMTFLSLCITSFDLWDIVVLFEVVRETDIETLEIKHLADQRLIHKWVGRNREVTERDARARFVVTNTETSQEGGKKDRWWGRRRKTVSNATIWVWTSTVMYGERQEDKSRRESMAYKTQEKENSGLNFPSPPGMNAEHVSRRSRREWVVFTFQAEGEYEGESHSLALHTFPSSLRLLFLPSSSFILPNLRWLMFMSSGPWMTPALNNMSSPCTKKKVCSSRGIRC